jgi:hypothetical protein
VQNEAAMNRKPKKTTKCRAAVRTKSASANKAMLEYVEHFSRNAYRERALLIRDYRRELAPTTPEETSVVDELATAHWLLQLAGRYEDTLIEEKANELAAKYPEAEDFNLILMTLDMLDAEGGEYAVAREMNDRYSRELIQAASRWELLRAKTENRRTN